MAFAALTIDLNAKLAKFETDLARAGKGMDALNSKANNLAAGFKSAFGQLGLSIGAGFAVKSLAAMADQFSSLQARLKLASRDVAEFNAANADLVRIAQTAQAPLNETATLYTRIAASVKDLEVSQGEIAGTTEAVALALKISGASAAEASSAMLQFSQAIASGVLRGEEFNAVNESAPRLLQALAASLKVPVGELREMAKQGQLTRDVLINGLLQQLPKLQQEAATLPKTIGAAFTDLNNKLILAVGELDKATRATSGLSTAISAIGTTGIEALAVLGANLAFVFQGVGREIGGIAAQLSRLAVGDFRGFSIIGKEMRADAIRARKELDEFEKRILGGSTSKAALAATATARRVIPAIKALGSDKTAKTKLDEIDPFYKERTAALKAQADEIKKFIDEQQDAINGLNREMAQDGVAAADAYASALAALLGDTDVANTQELYGNIEILNKAFFDGIIGIQQYDQAIQKLTEGTKESGKEMDSFAKTAAENIQNSFAQFLFDPFDQGLKGMLQGFGQMIQKMIAEAVAADLARKLFGSLVTGGSGTGLAGNLLSGFGSLLGLANGGIVGSGGMMPLQKYASGGIANSPQLAVFGEGSMNEAFVPLPDGRAIPVRMKGGSGNTIIVNVSGTHAPDVRRAAGQGAREALSLMNGAGRYA